VKRRRYALASQRKELKGFTYVYVLLSEKDATHRYTDRPWQIETAIAFRSREKAAAFEKYLKSHSGRAFASKHF
jgi:hypothetical protein